MMNNAGKTNSTPAAGTDLPAHPVTGANNPAAAQRGDKGAMPRRDQHHQQQQTDDKAEDPDDTLVDRLARTIDPPSRDVKDSELIDPGRATPGAPPVDNRS